MNVFSIYNNFVYINDKKPKSVTNKILAKTKELTLSSKDYNKYLELFSDISQDKYIGLKTDYPLPIISPIKRKKNKNLFYKERKILTPKLSKKQIKSFYINDNNKEKNKYSSNKTLKNKNINFFICDFDYLKKEEQKNNYKNNNNYQTYFCLTQENFVKYKKKIKNKYNKEYNKDKNENNIKINNNKEKSSKKQIFCLLDSIFNKEKNDEDKNEENDNIIYNEKEIFGYKDIYLEYLKNELISLTKKEKEINMNSKISYNYNNKIYGKIIMEINSAKIEVFNKINDVICSIFNIPFNLLCIFYLSTVKQLAHIILNIYKNEFFLSNQKLSNEEIKKILENIMEYQITYKNNNLFFKNNFEDEDKKNIANDYLSYRNLKFRTNVRYNILSLSKKEESLKKVNFENCTFNNYKNSNYKKDLNENIYNKNIESMKNLFDSNINIVNLSWITHDKNYLIKITMPHISIKMPNYKKQINHFINKEIFVFLYKNNFKNWNFYISHYLFTLKKFRICINNILSYYTLFNFIKRKNKNKRNFKFDKKEIESHKNYISNNISSKNLYNNLLYEIHNLSNTKYEQYENSLNDNEYIFFVSDDEYIHLYKMKSYVLFAYSCNDLKLSKINFFDFSFYQMKILFYKSKYENLAQFLQRLIKVNKENKKIYLDYNYFNTYKQMENKQIAHHFKESYLLENVNKNNLIINNSNKISINSDNSNKIIEKELVLKVSNPKFISVSIKKNKNINSNIVEQKWLKKEGEIRRNLMEKLVENDIKNWGTILWQNKDGIEALKNSKNAMTRRSNFFKGKKDFKAVFKKFLKIK